MDAATTGAGQADLPFMDGSRRAGLVIDLGNVPYEPTWTAQRALAQARRDGGVPDLLLLVEHPPTFTIGRSGRPEHLLAGPEWLAALGATVHMVDRGGDITYHGPGQLVAYPILDLQPRGRDVHRYLRALEEAIIRTVADFGIVAHRLPPHTGVWVGETKIAAIGVRVNRGVTLHGLALNVAPDLGHFDAIIPCGIRDKGVTSMRHLLGHGPEMEAVADRLTVRLGDLLGLRWRRASLRDLAVAPTLDALLTTTTDVPA